MPNGCGPNTCGPDPPAPEVVPPTSVQTSGTKGVGAKPPFQNWRKYSKSANTVRYLSQISRSNEPYRYSRSVSATDGVRSAKLKNLRSLGSHGAARLVYWVSVNWFE